VNAVARELVVDILKAKAGFIRIADDLEILDALAEIRERWETLRQAAGEAAPATVIEFIERLIAEAGDGPLVELLIGSGRDGVRLRAALARIADVFGKIDTKYQPLLLPVASFDADVESPNTGLVEWKVVGVEERASATAGELGYSLDLGAHASLQLEAGDSWAGEDPHVPDPLLRVGFVGALEVSAKAALRSTFGALKLEAEASREAALDYYFDARDSDDIYARAVQRVLGELPNPWSLASMMQAVDHAGFVGAVIETLGHSTVSVDVSVAEGFALSAELKANVDLSFSTRVARRGTFYVKLKKLVATMESAVALEVTLERKRATDREGFLELGIDVDAAALGRRLVKVLERHEGKMKDVLDEYREFLTPGTYLRGAGQRHLQGFIDDLTSKPKLRAALKDAADRALGATPAAASVEAFLEEQVADLFDGASGVIGGAVDGVAKEIAAAFMERTGLAGEAVDELVAEVPALIQRLRGDLEAKVKAAVGASASKLLKKLDGAGVKVARRGNRADNAFAGVREVIARHENAVDRLKKAVTDSAKMRLNAKITAVGRSTHERVVEARMIFKADSPEARQIYRRVLSGDLDAVLSLLDDGHPDVEVDREATALSAFKASGRKFGHAFVLLGFEVGGSTAFDAKSKVLVEGSGKVSVVSELTWKRRRSTPRKEREVSFVDSYELAAAKHTHDFRVDLALQHESEALRRRETQKLISSFENALLIPTGTTARAVAIFDEWFGTGDTKIAADIDFTLRLEGKEIPRLLCLGERAGDTISAAGRRRIFGIVLQALVQAGVHEQAHVAKLANLVHAQMKGDGEPSIVDVLFAYTSTEHRRVLANPDLSPTVNRHAVQDLSRARALHERCMSLVELIDLMGDIYEATPSLSPDGGWSELDYDTAQRQIAKHLKAWLKTSSRVFWISAEAHPLTVAFIGALAALAELGDVAEQDRVLSLTMTRRTVEPATVVLC
jgi:hypothetical protein